MVCQLFSEQPNQINTTPSVGTVAVNGQVAPKVTMAQGEVQWWRMIDAMMKASTTHAELLSNTSVRGYLGLQMLHLEKQIVTLLLNSFGERLPLFDIPLDEVNNKGKAQHRGDIVEDPKSRIDGPRREIIMEQDANSDEAVADSSAQKNCGDAKREYVEVDERNRNNEMVGIRDRANGPQDQHKWQPRRSIGSHILPQKRQQ